ncbi:MAG: tetratricopeptide repeat protein [Spirochaetota bacterium]
MNFKVCSVFFCMIFTAVVVSGCSEDRKAVGEAEKLLAQEGKSIQELEKVRGKLKRVIETKLQAVELQEEVCRLLGRKYMQIGSYNLAKEALLEAEKLKPYNAFIKMELGECYYFLGRAEEDPEKRISFYKKSKNYLETSLDINPDLLESRYTLGLLLFFGFGEVHQAIEQMKIILEYNPKYTEAHFALGRFYYEIGQLGKALNHYITLTRILPGDSAEKRKAEENILRINKEMEEQ